MNSEAPFGWAQTTTHLDVERQPRGPFSKGQFADVLLGVLGSVCASACLMVHADPALVWGNNNYGQTNPPPSATNVVAIAAGDAHCLALRSNGTVVAWGFNHFGQTEVPVDLTNAISVAAGGSHSLALRTDGTVALWGKIMPMGVTNVPPGLTNVVALALGPGAQHALVLRADGTVADWGLNYYGLTNVPPAAKGIVAVAAGSTFALALRSDGKVLSWGSQTNVPPSATNIVWIAGGWFGSAGLRADGTLLVWGTGSPPQGAGFTNLVDLACVGDPTAPLALLGARRDGSLVQYGGQPPPCPSNQIASVGAGSYNGLALVGGGPPVFPGFSVDRTVVTEETAYLRVNAVGQLPLAYQWSCNGTNIPGATDTLLVLPQVHPEQTGSSYTLTAANALGRATSRPIILHETPLEFVVQPQQVFTPAGSAVTLVATDLIGTGPFAFRWAFEGNPLDRATNAVLTLSNLQTDQSGLYSVTLSNQYGSVTNATRLSVQPPSFNLASTNLYLSPDGFHFQLDSVFATNAVLVLASQDGIGWVPILTNPPATGSVRLLDPRAIDHAARYYRALEQ